MENLSTKMTTRMTKYSNYSYGISDDTGGGIGNCDAADDARHEDDDESWNVRRSAVQS
jgi:hypothetical protein